MNTEGEVRESRDDPEGQTQHLSITLAQRTLRRQTHTTYTGTETGLQYGPGIDGIDGTRK